MTSRLQGRRATTRANEASFSSLLTFISARCFIVMCLICSHWYGYDPTRPLGHSHSISCLGVSPFNLTSHPGNGNITNGLELKNLFRPRRENNTCPLARVVSRILVSPRIQPSNRASKSGLKLVTN